MTLNEQQLKVTPIDLWFQLIDCSISQIYKETTTSCVSVPSNHFIVQFRDAVRNKFADSLLKSVDAPELVVYKNKAAFDKRNAAADDGKEEPLKVDSLVVGLGNSCKEPLIVAFQPSGTRSDYTCIPEKLDLLGIKYDIEAINYILRDGGTARTNLLSPSLTRHDAETILGNVSMRYRPWMQDTIRSHCSVLLGAFLNEEKCECKSTHYYDYSIDEQVGNRKSRLYHAYSVSGRLLVAKVYNRHKQDFLREVEVNDALEHENLVKFIEAFSLQDRHVIIMPYFPISVATMLNQLLDEFLTLPVETVRLVAQGCFDALVHLHSKGYCFTDLKPANIMLSGGEQCQVTLVGYGSIVRMGNPLVDYTELYSLDANREIATEQLDWICLGSTLAEMSGFKIQEFDKASRLCAAVRGQYRDKSMQRFIVSCLASPTLAEIKARKYWYRPKETITQSELEADEIKFELYNY